jgi:hypothetical protein
VHVRVHVRVHVHVHVHVHAEKTRWPVLTSGTGSLNTAEEELLVSCI